MKKHYIFKATGIDTSRHNKKRTEFRHGLCSCIEEANLCAAYYRAICFEAGWDKVKVDVYTVAEMKHVLTIKGEQHDHRTKKSCACRSMRQNANKCM